MNPISHNNGSIKEDNEIDPKFNCFPIPENDNIENFQEIFDNMEEVSENMNFGSIANISQVEQNETHNEIQIELNETHKDQNEAQSETLILVLNHEEIEKNLVLNKLDDSLNSKVEDKLGNLCNCSKEINSFTYKYEEKKIPKKEGSSMEFLKKKRNSK